VHHAYSTNVAKTILFTSLNSKAISAVWLLFSINDSGISCAVWR